MGVTCLGGFSYVTRRARATVSGSARSEIIIWVWFGRMFGELNDLGNFTCE